jgi:hypothetical protein
LYSLFYFFEAYPEQKKNKTNEDSLPDLNAEETHLDLLM